MAKFRPLFFTVLCITLAFAMSGCGSGQGVSGPGSDSQGLKKIIIAEPVHLIGYLPLYAAEQEGYFKKHGLDVQFMTATGGAHVTAVVSGQAWGVIGGPESNALANQGNPDPIISVVNVVNRANVYLMAKADTGPKSDSPADLKAFLRGKRIAAGRHGGTPNLLTRYLLIQLGLNPDKDVQILEPADATAVVAMVQQGLADVANGAEPQIVDGITKRVWDEPFYKFPSMGDYSYSVVSVKNSTIQKDPETVQQFVDAVVEVLKKMQSDKTFAAKVAKKQFPTLSDQAIQASLDRAYADHLWSTDGMITPQALKRDMDVMITTGIFKGSYTYDGLVDMEFVKKAK